MRVLFCYLFLCSFSCFWQKQAGADFTKVSAEMFPIPESKEIYGKATYEFELITKTDSIFLDAVNMTFSELALNGNQIPFSNSGKRLGFKAPSKRGQHELVLRYIAKPNQTVYFITSTTLSDQNKRSSVTEDSRSDRDEKVASRGLSHQIEKKHLDCARCDNLQIWTQGQGKYTSHWLPSIDDMNDKIEFDLTFLVENEHEVIANGKLLEKIPRENRIAWKFDMTQPMSSYLAAFVIGNFDKKVLQSKSGIPIELYYEPKDSLNIEPTYRYTREIFDFLEEEIGVAYPWQNYKQVPVQDFLYAGMENTTCTIFSNQYVIDSTAFVDKNYVNVNVHELAHQWFGNLVTEQSGEHHWLHEGFATYYAYLAEKNLFGDDHFYWKLYQTAKTLHNRSENQGGEALSDPNANSLTFYEKGAWALVMLRELVGDNAFKEGIRNYLNAYAFQNATIDDFLAEMEKSSEQDLGPFREKWLESETFPWEEVRSLLVEKNASLKQFFAAQQEIREDVVIDENVLMRFWEDEQAIPFKREFLLNYASRISDSSLVALAENESVQVRQALALAIPEISTLLRPTFESLLTDESYVTQEAALFRLWRAFPENRVGYIEALDGVVGLPNKNIRQLWLALALITKEFQPENKKTFYAELNRYSEPHYNFEVRQLAFQYLHQIGAMNDSSLRNLLQAANHHVWQFKKSSRNLLREIYRTEEGKRQLNDIKPLLSEQLLKVWEIVLAPK